MSCEFGEQVSAVSAGVLDWVFTSAWIRGVRAEELRTKTKKGQQEFQRISIKARRGVISISAFWVQLWMDGR